MRDFPPAVEDFAEELGVVEAEEFIIELERREVAAEEDACLEAIEAIEAVEAGDEAVVEACIEEEATFEAPGPPATLELAFRADDRLEPRAEPDAILLCREAPRFDDALRILCAMFEARDLPAAPDAIEDSRVEPTADER